MSDPAVALVASPPMAVPFIDWLSREASTSAALSAIPAAGLAARRKLLDVSTFSERDAFSSPFGPDADAREIERYRVLNALGIQVAWTIQWHPRSGFRFFRMLVPGPKYAANTAMADQLSSRAVLPQHWQRETGAFRARQEFCREHALGNHALFTGQLVAAGEDQGRKRVLGIDGTLDALSLYDEPFSITLVADPVPPALLSGALDFLLAGITQCLRGADLTITASRNETTTSGRSELDPRYRVHRAVAAGVQGVVRTLSQAAAMMGALAGVGVPLKAVAGMGLGSIDVADLFGWSAQISSSTSRSETSQVTDRIVDERRTFLANKLRELTELFADGGQFGLWSWYGAVSARSQSVSQSISDIFGGRLSGASNTLECLRTRDVDGSNVEAVETAIDYAILPRMDRPMGLLGSSYGSIAQTSAMPFLFAPPTRSHRGVRAIKLLPVSFTRSVAEHSVALGQRLDGEASVRLGLDELAGHLLVCGRTGSGKTTLLRRVLRQLSQMEAPIPFLFIDMAQSITKESWGFVPDAMMYEGPRQDFAHTMPSLGLLDFGRPEDYEHHVWQLADLLTNWLPSEGPIALLLTELLHQAYATVCDVDGHFWLSGEPDVPRLESLEAHVASLFEDSARYAGELRGNLASALVTRLRRLRSTALGSVMGGTSTDLFRAFAERRSCVMSLARSGSTNERCFVALAMLMKTRQWLRDTREQTTHGRPRLVIAIDEAHILLRKSAERDRGSDSNIHSYAVRWFDELVAEIRQLGGCVVILDQSPSILADSVLFGTANKVVFPLASGADMRAIAAALALAPEQVEGLGTIPNMMAYAKTAASHDLSVLRTVIDS